MDVNGLKFVNFKKYCDKCIHKDVNEIKEPCNSCLEEPARYATAVPVNFKDKE